MEAVRDTKARAGHVARLVTRQEKANAEAKVALIGELRRSRKNKEGQCNVW